MQRLPTFDEYARLESVIEAKAAELRLELGEPEPIDESIALGAFLALPTVLELAGHFLLWLGHRHSDVNVLTRIGHTIEKFGNDLQSSMLRVIELALKPFIFWMKPSDQESVAKALFIAFLALKIVSTPGAADSVVSIEAAIAAVDTKEVIAGIKSVGPRLVRMLQ
jgi:hypothetical protein